MDVDVKPKRKTKTSSSVKNRYNLKSYDRLQSYVYKGERELLRQIAVKNNLSLNALVTTALNEWLTSRGYQPVMVKDDDGQE